MSRGYRNIYTYSRNMMGEGGKEKYPFDIEMVILKPVDTLKADRIQRYQLARGINLMAALAVVRHRRCSELRSTLVVAR